MNRFTQQVLPILMGVAAVLISVAAVVVIVGQLRGHDEPTRAETPAAAFAQAAGPAMQAFARGLGDRLGQTYLGVTVQVQSGGLLVQAVMPGSPADHAGVQVGDVITALNGTKVTSADQLRSLLNQVGSGKTYTLDVTRDGATKSLQVQQATLGDAAGSWFQGMFGDGAAPNGRFGGFGSFGGPRRGDATPTPGGPQA